jgi:hypothetical protein
VIYTIEFRRELNLEDQVGDVNIFLIIPFVSVQCNGLNWIQVAQNEAEWRNYVDTIMNLWLP